MSHLYKIFWVALIIKLALSALIPLTNDEAYYWVWSQHMQLSFYDHPPFVAWLYWLGQQMNFYGNMVRWPGVLLGQGTLALWLVLLKPYLNDKQRTYWLLLAVLSPLVGGTDIVVTPDLPLLFFYALSLLTFYRWRANPHLGWAVAFGLSMGLGFTSKYVMVLFPLSLFPLVYLSRELRAPLLKSFPWILLGAAIGAAPVWVWNALNQFVSFRFQADHGLGATVWKRSWTSDYVLVQLGLIFPPLLYWAVKSRRNLPLVFNLLAWVPVVFFFFTTFRGYVEANWPIVAYPAIFALAVSAWPKNRLSLKFTAGTWATAMAAFALVITLQPAWSKSMKFKEFSQFDGLIASARDLSPLYARSYQMAARMHYEMKRPIYKLKGMNRKDFYDYLEPSTPAPGLYYLAVEKGDHLPKDYLDRGHKIVRVLPVDEQFEIWQVQSP